MQTGCWQFDAHGQPSEQLHWREQDLPEPGPGQALVRMRAVGLNRSELRYVQGTYVPPRSFPTCLGHEGVGEIVALGPGAAAQGPSPMPQTPLKVGARVALMPGRVDVGGMGSYRELGVYDQAALLPVPERYSDAEGAALWMGTLTAGGGFSAAGLSAETAPGKTVLITAAASGMGVIALKLARAFGARTIGVTRSARKAEQLADLADQVLVCPDASELAGQIKDATKGKGFDVAFDPVGASYTGPLMEAAAPLAHIVIYEMITGREPTVSLPALLVKDLSLHGFTLFRLMRQPAVAQWVVSETLRLSDELVPVVADTFPLSEAPAALTTLDKTQHLGKLVLLSE